MTNMEKLAEHIIAIADKNNIYITNLILHKVLYFTLKESVTDKNIYDMPFTVWRNGPVVKPIYDKYKIWGSNKILETSKEYEEFSHLNGTIVKYLNVTVWYLVDSCLAEPIWQLNKDKIKLSVSDVEYSWQDIKDPYHIWQPNKDKI